MGRGFVLNAEREVILVDLIVSTMMGRGAVLNAHT